jgi:hypothetical protein
VDYPGLNSFAAWRFSHSKAMLCQLFVSPSWGHHFINCIFALHIILPGTTLPQFSLLVVSPFAVHCVWSPTANL